MSVLVEINGEVEKSKKSGLLHLNQYFLWEIPSLVYTLDSLYRLDLGFNDIEVIPDAVGQLINLEILWLNDNPLTSLSAGISKCKKLKELDLTNTKLTHLPYEIGRLEHLVVLEVENVPLNPNLREELLASKVSCPFTAIVQYLKRHDDKITFQKKLDRKLKEGVYREISDTAQGQQSIEALVQRVFLHFTESEEMKSLVRNADRLFPSNILKANAEKIYQQYIQLKRENDMKKLGAELELKIRQIYFDRIDPSSVQDMVKAIYKVIKDLDDVKFLLRFAPSLFPTEAQDVDATKLLTNLRNLQQTQARERQAAIESLLKAVKVLYSDVEPEKIRLLVMEISELFKKANDIKSLAADVDTLFPADALDAVPIEIKRSFVKNRSNLIGK